MDKGLKVVFKSLTIPTENGDDDVNPDVSLIDQSDVIETCILLCDSVVSLKSVIQGLQQEVTDLKSHIRQLDTKFGAVERQFWSELSLERIQLFKTYPLMTKPQNNTTMAPNMLNRRVQLPILWFWTPVTPPTTLTTSNCRALIKRRFRVEIWQPQPPVTVSLEHQLLNIASPVTVDLAEIK